MVHMVHSCIHWLRVLTYQTDMRCAIPQVCTNIGPKWLHFGSAGRLHVYDRGSIPAEDKYIYLADHQTSKTDCIVYSIRFLYALH